MDFVINAIIAAAYERGRKQEKESVDFFNTVLTPGTLPSWGTINIKTSIDKRKINQHKICFSGTAVAQGREFFYQNPLCFSLWYPDGSIKSNYWHHLFCVIFFHYVPAYFIDGLLVLMRRKPL